MSGADSSEATIALRALQYVFPPSALDGCIRGAIDVEAPAEMHWTASVEASWLFITTGTQGTGNGTILYDVESNDGEARQGLIRVGEASMTVYQLAAADWLSKMVLHNESVPAIVQQGIEDMAEELNKLPPPLRAAGYAALTAWIFSVATQAEGIYESFPGVPHIFPHSANPNKDLAFVMNELHVLIDFVGKKAAG